MRKAEMRGGDDTGRRLHTAQKAGRAHPAAAWRRILVVLAGIAVLAGAGWGVAELCRKLHEMWVSMCVVTDAKSQVRIEATPHIPVELVRREWFGLTNGCNLALIDFAAKREEIIRRHPIVRDMSITRHLPDGVDISLMEREPIARVNPRKRSGSFMTWDVADADGVVFNFQIPASAHLPIISGAGPATPVGESLSGRTRAALRLVEIAARQEFRPFTLERAEISAAGDTYLVATTRDHNRFRVSWRLIDVPEASSRANIATILSNFRDTIAANLYASPQCFTASRLDQVAVQPESMPTEEITTP